MDNSTSSLSKTFTWASSGSLEVEYWVDSEDGYDFLRIGVQGYAPLEVTGYDGSPIAGTYTQPVQAGSRLVTISYIKDGSTSEGADSARIYEIRRWDGGVLETIDWNGATTGQVPPGWTGTWEAHVTGSTPATTSASPRTGTASIGAVKGRGAAQCGAPACVGVGVLGSVPQIAVPAANNAVALGTRGLGSAVPSEHPALMWLTRGLLAFPSATVSAPFAITGVTPSTIVAADTPIYIDGTGFRTTDRVRFGRIRIRSLPFVSSTQLHVHAPVELVTNPGRYSLHVSRAYVYTTTYYVDGGVPRSDSEFTEDDDFVHVNRYVQGEYSIPSLGWVELWVDTGHYMEIYNTGAQTELRIMRNGGNELAYATISGAAGTGRIELASSGHLSAYINGALRLVADDSIYAGGSEQGLAYDGATVSNFIVG